MASSTSEQIVTPDDGDGGFYVPDPSQYYVRFLAQPAAADDVTGLYGLRPVTYDALDVIEASAAASWSGGWTRQQGTIEVGGVTLDVWLNRASQNQWTNPRGGERLWVVRG